MLLNYLLACLFKSLFIRKFIDIVIHINIRNNHFQMFHLNHSKKTASYNTWRNIILNLLNLRIVAGCFVFGRLCHSYCEQKFQFEYIVSDINRFSIFSCIFLLQMSWMISNSILKFTWRRHFFDQNIFVRIDFHFCDENIFLLIPVTDRHLYCLSLPTVWHVGSVDVLV